MRLITELVRILGRLITDFVGFIHEFVRFISDFIRFLGQNWREILTVTWEHLLLVLVATSIAVAIGIPIGILLSRKERWRGPVLGLANVMQTVPSLALFGFLIPLPFICGIGARAAVGARFAFLLLSLFLTTRTPRLCVVGLAG